MTLTADEQKRAAALRALDFVEDGQRLGLGTGSTAAHFVDLLGGRVAEGLSVRCVPTSEATRVQAERLSIPLATLDEMPELDLTVDGADEIGPGLALIKGGGGALLREKIVASASARMLVIADASKHVETLGAFPLPVEVVKFGMAASERAMSRAFAGLGLGGEIVARKTGSGALFETDNGNHIFDCHLRRIEDPAALAAALAAIAGVVEHGLFIGLAGSAIVAGPDGVQLIEAAA
ncbi:MAG TPA: ribose-5-phosphate isomerase RpiA [Hyphomicrobiales bacterium]|nr:ribose-5-phosphate isomerase RpiA [Rhodobiaceae bacterium]HXK53056.1 ribose-5-phosphate isomerase RpiA [Hyphomicrobiales bacterium]